MRDALLIGRKRRYRKDWKIWDGCRRMMESLYVVVSLVGAGDLSDHTFTSGLGWKRVCFDLVLSTTTCLMLDHPVCVLQGYSACIVTAMVPASF